MLLPAKEIGMVSFETAYGRFLHPFTHVYIFAMPAPMVGMATMIPSTMPTISAALRSSSLVVLTRGEATAGVGGGTAGAGVSPVSATAPPSAEACGAGVVSNVESSCRHKTALL